MEEDRQSRSTPETFRARSLSVSMTVKDLPASIAWYTDIVGFVIDQKYEREGTVVAASLKAGTVQVLLNQDDGAKGWDRAKGVGISLHFTTAQDVDTVAQRIRDAGGILASEPADMPWGARVFNLVDPDGFKLSITTEVIPPE